MRRALLFVTTASLFLAVTGGTALANGREVCIGGPGTALTTPNADGHCKNGHTLTPLASQSEVTRLQTEVTHLQEKVGALEDKLSKVSYRSDGLNGKPTLEISGANLQIVDGSGTTDGPVNGLGNLFIGYDKHVGPQTGSNNLILGSHQSFTSYGGLVAGQYNALSAPFASVSGGAENKTSGLESSVSGGYGNEASGIDASVSGGFKNTVTGTMGSVSGGYGNEASGLTASVSGGRINTALAKYSSILGGTLRTVSTVYGTSP